MTLMSTAISNNWHKLNYIHDLLADMYCMLHCNNWLNQLGVPLIYGQCSFCSFLTQNFVTVFRRNLEQPLFVKVVSEISEAVLFDRLW